MHGQLEAVSSGVSKAWRISSIGTLRGLANSVARVTRRLSAYDAGFMGFGS